MAYSAVPTTHIAGYQLVTATGTTLTAIVATGAVCVIIPLTTLVGLTEAEGNGATGDIRKIWKALVDMIQTRWAAIALADRPTKIGATLTVHPLTNTVVRKNHVLFFDEEITASDVQAE
jgi:hypothetical protein